MFPLLPGTPQNCLRRFCGEPHSGLLPHCVTARARLRGDVNFAAHLSHGCSFSPSEYTFGGDPLESSVLYHGSIAYPLPAGFPLICPTENSFGGDPDRSPLKGNPPFRGKPDAIDALRSNRYTFGAARRDWRGAQQSLDLRFGHFYPLSYTRRKMSELRYSSAGTRSEASVSAFSRREEEQPRGRQADRRKAAYGDEPCGLRRGSTPKEITSCQAMSRSGCT